eukprot:g10693.t1
MRGAHSITVVMVLAQGSVRAFRTAVVVGLSRRTSSAAALNRARVSSAMSLPYSWAARPMSTLRAGATTPDGGGEADSEAVEVEKKAIEEGAAAAKAMMDATEEFKAKQVAEGLPADAPLPDWFLRDLEANKAKEAEAEKEKKREAVRATNPYMMQEGLPKFESITPEASTEAFEVLLEDLETGFAKFEEDLINFTSSESWGKQRMRHDFAGVVERMERLRAPLEYAWGVMSHLTGVKNSDPLRDAHQELQPKVVTIFQKIGQSKEVYDALKFLQVPACRRLMTEAQIRVVDASVKQMELGGVGLEGEAKEEFNKIQLELADLSTKFSNNVLDATKAFSLTMTDKADVEGLPASALGLAAQSAKAAGEENATGEEGPWRLTLDMPSYLPCMQHLKNREVREKLYRAFTTRASSTSVGEEGKSLDNEPHIARILELKKRMAGLLGYDSYAEVSLASKVREKLYRAFTTRASSTSVGEEGKSLDNEPHIARILELKKRMAGLLGYDSYAEVSLASKMADSVKAVDDLSGMLREKSYPAAERELEELKAYAKENGHEGDLALWDVTYWSERRKEELYAFSEEELRPYFALPEVLQGMFGLAGRLFGVTITPADGEAEVWNPDVRFFNIKDKSSGDHVASFYLDAYSRPEDKRGGAWMGVCLGASKVLERDPVAYLTCNGSPPVGDTPSLMTFREVETLFHEFGHGLQHMLTTMKDGDCAGINGVEWDAVELPSQFMENWCYHKPTVDQFAKHHETGETLPTDLFNKLCAQRTYMAGSTMLRQLYFGQLDMELHHRYDPSGDEALLDVQRRVAKEFTVLPPLPEDRFLCAFGHIFAGGYAAGYYSYKYAEVMSADAFAAFEEAGLDDEEAVSSVGMRFKDTVLAMGGGRHPSKVFRDFRGRDPTPEALLKHSGLAAAVA